MLQSISTAKFIEWMAFYELDPWGEQRADMRAAQHMAILVNMNLKKGVKAKTLEDFMLFPEKTEPVEMTEAESIAYIQRALRGL